ncbi:MAG: hypothetical protein QOC75_5582 [Pseudonocardiales bacterium]|nr:hypothetical protein [Pseudonocardiales bacterium]
MSGFSQAGRPSAGTARYVVIASAGRVGRNSILGLRSNRLCDSYTGVQDGCPAPISASVFCRLFAGGPSVGLKPESWQAVITWSNSGGLADRSASRRDSGASAVRSTESCARGESVAGRQRGQDAVLPHGDQPQLGAGRDAAHEGRLQLAAAHPVQPDLGPGVLQLDGELGHQVGECPEYLVQPVTQPLAGTHSDGHRGQLGHRRAGPLRRTEGGSGLGQEPFAGGGQPDVAGRAVEQLDAELALQPADLLADRGLNDGQPLGGPPEVQLLGHRDEVAQLPQLHALPRRTR